VPFSPLWQQVLNETQSNSLFRSLKRFLSWLLQLVFLALVLLAIADPALTGNWTLTDKDDKTAELQHTLLLFDVSASMQATDIPGGRFAAAQREALKIISERATTETMMVASVGRDILTQSDWTVDNRLLQSAIEAIRPTESTSDAAHWLNYARNAVRGLDNARVVLITDRGFDPIDHDLTKSINLQVVSVEARQGSESRSNVAIADFIVRSHLGNSLKYALYYRLRNNAENAVTVKTYLHVDPTGEAQIAADFRTIPPIGKPVTHTLGPGEEKTFERTEVSLNGTRAALMIEAEGIRDMLPADDVAYSIIPERKKVRVALVGPQHMFVEAALRARTHVEVVHVPLEEWKNSQGFDLVVFNGVAPDKIPSGNSIWLDVEKGSPARVKGRTEGGELTVPSSRSRHPAMRYVRFVELEPKEIQRVIPRNNELVLARTKLGRRPVVVASSTQEVRWLTVGFDPIESEWVTHYSFSVFFVNAINWFFQEESRFSRTLNLARRWNVKVPWPKIKQVQIKRPSGQIEAALVDDGGRLAYSGQEAGFYEIRPPGAQNRALHSVAASLVNPKESALHSTGDYEPYTPQKSSIDPLDRTPSLIGGTPWQYLIIIALCLTLLEWFTYNRRWTV
jgi:hypothetical protein